jgi:uncharacterized protein (TIRG00374 family)
MKKDLLKRFQRWLLIALTFGILLYLIGSVWAGLSTIQDQLFQYHWWAFAVAIALTLSNYALRFVKWHYLCNRLSINISLKDNAWIFLAGLSMAISPGKAGELLKPYALREKTGTAMAHSIPALITERLTDGIAMLILAAIGVTSYAAGKIHFLLIPGIITIMGLLILAHEGFSLWILKQLGKLPIINKVSDKLTELYRAMRTCLAPVSLIWTVILSLFAWAAECVAFQVIFQGMGVENASFDICFFVYAFATVAGSAMPGGLGVTDGALIGGAQELIVGISPAQATLAAILTRIATMWFGVALGAIALFRISSLLDQNSSEESVKHE